MAKQRPKYEELALSILKESYPSAFKIGRIFALAVPETERTLFTKMEEDESGNYIISGLTQKVSELDFSAFSLGLAQALYNQSYQSGNADVNSGLKREIVKGRKKEGEDCYWGYIEISLNDLCRYAYGAEPDTKSKKKMSTLLDVIDSSALEITAPNGDFTEKWLCRIMERTTRAKDGAVTYHLILNPLFGFLIKNQYGELPQDIVKRLTATTKKKTAQHYILLRWLSVQDSRKPHTLFIGTLIQNLRMEKYYRENKGKAEKQLLSVFDSMVKIKMLNSYEVEYKVTGKRRSLHKVTFHINRNLVRKHKENNDEPETPETK